MSERQPLLVYWQGDGEQERTTEVVRACARCLPGGELPLLPNIVSPRGVAHEARRGDTTDCGHDCTGPEWWHRG